MAQVKFTHALKRFFPEIKPMDMIANDVKSLLGMLEERHPGLQSYILDDYGSVREHVNIFVDGEMILDRQSLSDQLNENSEVYIMQALSGG